MLTKLMRAANTGRWMLYQNYGELFGQVDFIRRIDKEGERYYKTKPLTAPETKIKSMFFCSMNLKVVVL